MDRRMMNAWLAEQAKKQELTTTKMQQKRLGINLNESGKQDPEKIVGGLPANPSQAGGSNLRPVNPRTPQFTDAEMKEMIRQADVPVKPPVKGAWQEYARTMAARGTGIGTMGPGGQHGSLEGLQEQLNAEEEAYAKSHKSMLAGMIKQYGKEKGTRVFYASVRNAVKKKKD